MRKSANAMLSIADAITGRRSVRAYLDKPVPRESLNAVLRVASRAPSGSNIQPWHVYVLEGPAKARLTETLTALAAAGDPGSREYNYYPVAWRDPYQARRRACGFGLYKTLGIGRDDRARMAEQHGQNFKFFGAPVGLIFSIDRDMEQGSWLDYGMFVQSIMLAARGEGLDTCPQAAFAYFAPTVQKTIGMPEGQMVVCGMSLGYADPDAVVNTFVTEREPLDTFVTYVA
jgi:nitroreductase